MRLVIVESPTKARTIRKFLSSREYRIEACMGHVRDLPASASEIPSKYKGKDWARLGVNVEEGFEPLYIVPSDKKKVIKGLKEALKNAEVLYIATDEDREGESIGWHLLQTLKPKIPVRRMVFHEITKEAILNALNETRDVDQRLVEAQETRRVLDRLVGYEISPLLWRKVAPRLSAGRVQSVAVRLIVLREKERIAFVSGGYWDLKAKLKHAGHLFDAEMTHWAGQRLATGRDFDENTGKLHPDRKVLLLEEEPAKALAERLKNEPWRVASVVKKKTIRKPYAPFITSTLQQEANRKLGLPARKTMQLAQKLYEQGLITYMRTDSTNLSQEAIEASRRAIEGLYGKAYLSAKPRQFSSSSKNAQEAHEAIRPAGTEMRTRSQLHLSGQEGALYDLIWKRTVASQMANAELEMTTATIEAGSNPKELGIFRASGKRIVFAGFFRAYVEGSDDPDTALEDQEKFLPALQEGDQPDCKDVIPLGHETKPPARFTEATLVKELEKLGIGRPSTYASIIGTIVGRGYIRRRGRQLIPTFTAFATNNVLEQQFDPLVDFNFTARMEQALDDIAAGKQEATPYLTHFYFDKDGLKSRVEKGLDQIDARKVSTLQFPQWDPFTIRVGKFGPYVEGPLNGETATASLPEELAPDEVTPAKLEELLHAKQEPKDQLIGIHPKLDQPLFVKEGPYGPYVQLGDNEQGDKPKRVSLPKGMQPTDVTLDVAVELLTLPRTVGTHPESGEPILANVGRYGPYVQHKRTFASLTADDNVLTVRLDRALTLLATKEKKNEPLRVIGNHPETGEPIQLFAGRYGPYVKHQRLNASLPKDADQDALTLEEAIMLLQERANKKGTRRKKGRRSKK